MAAVAKKRGRSRTISWTTTLRQIEATYLVTSDTTDADGPEPEEVLSASGLPVLGTMYSVTQQLPCVSIYPKMYDNANNHWEVIVTWKLELSTYPTSKPNKNRPDILRIFPPWDRPFDENRSTLVEDVALQESKQDGYVIDDDPAMLDQPDDDWEFGWRNKFVNTAGVPFQNPLPSQEYGRIITITKNYALSVDDRTRLDYEYPSGASGIIAHPDFHLKVWTESKYDLLIGRCNNDSWRDYAIEQCKIIDINTDLEFEVDQTQDIWVYWKVTFRILVSNKEFYHKYVVNSQGVTEANYFSSAGANATKIPITTDLYWDIVSGRWEKNSDNTEVFKRGISPIQLRVADGRIFEAGEPQMLDRVGRHTVDKSRFAKIIFPNYDTIAFGDYLV